VRPFAKETKQKGILECRPYFIVRRLKLPHLSISSNDKLTGKSYISLDCTIQQKGPFHMFKFGMIWLADAIKHE